MGPACFLLNIARMHQAREVETAILRAAARFDLIAGLERAIDASYKRAVKAAARHWERGIGSNDPLNACVSVHIEAPAAAAIPTAGILSTGKRPLAVRPRIPSPGLAL